MSTLLNTRRGLQHIGAQTSIPHPVWDPFRIKLKNINTLSILGALIHGPVLCDPKQVDQFGHLIESFPNIVIKELRDKAGVMEGALSLYKSKLKQLDRLDLISISQGYAHLTVLGSQIYHMTSECTQRDIHSDSTSDLFHSFEIFQRNSAGSAIKPDEDSNCGRIASTISSLIIKTSQEDDLRRHAAHYNTLSLCALQTL